MSIRKIAVLAEIIEADETGQSCDPIHRAAAIAIIRNPFAGAFTADLSPLFAIAADVGERLTAAALAQIPGAAIGYGKAAIVGADGAMEHGAAVLHPTLGKPMRAAIGGGKALIPANCKTGGLGAPIDIPLGHKDDPWMFDHIDTMTVSIADAPRADEIALCVAFSDGPRPNARVGSGPQKA